MAVSYDLCCKTNENKFYQNFPCNFGTFGTGYLSSLQSGNTNISWGVLGVVNGGTGRYPFHKLLSCFGKLGTPNAPNCEFYF